MPSFDELYSATRTRLITLLRGRPYTIPELADELGVSANAVRSHVSALESDGVVRQVGVRREGVGKPARVYDVTDSARERLSRAYAPALETVVEVLKADLGPGRTEDLLREAGRRIGESAAAAGGLDDRLRTAGAVFADLGAKVEVEEDDGRITLRGAGGCPLGRVVRAHPEACVLARALLEEILARGVDERCDRSESTPRCCFVVTANGDGGASGGG